MNLFERAARGKWRFQTPQGLIMAEQLFDLSLDGSGVNLDDIAKELYGQLEESKPMSFVSPAGADKQRATLQGMFDMVMHVIESKQRDQQMAVTRQENAAQKSRIIEALAAKKDQALGEKSVKQLEKELAALEEVDA